MTEPKIETEVDTETEEKISQLEQIYANKFFLVLNQEGIIRLAFVDTVSEKCDSDYIISILMTPAGLMSLKAMIDDFILKHQNKAQAPTEIKKPERETLQ